MWSKIGDICTVFSARRVHQSDWTKQGIPFYRAREIVKLAEHGYVDNELFISRELFEEFSRDGLMPDAGDIMISAVGTIGRTYIVQQTDKFYFKDASVLCLKNSHLNSDYLDIYLQSSFAKAQMISGSKGTTVDTITIEKANDYLIPIPPKDEQKRIIASIRDILPFINKIEAEKKELKRLVDKSKELVLELAIKGKLVPQLSSDEPALELLKRINPAFKPSDNLHYGEGLPNGWTLAPLSAFCTTINGLWKGNREPLVKVGVIRNANFTKDFGLDYSKIEYIDVELKSFEKRNLEDGDIVVEKSGGSDNFPVGRSILYNGENRKYSFSNFTMSLRIIDKSEILPRYLYYVLQYKYRRGDMKQMQTQTTGLHNLLTEKFLAAPIPIPPVGEQERIVLAIESLFRTVDGIRYQIKDGE